MSSIQRMPTATPTSASQIPFNDPVNGRDSKASLADFAAVLQELLAPPGPLITQYAAPNANAFAVTIQPPTHGTSMYLLLTPTAGFASGSITLPPVDTCIDGQEVLVSCTQTLGALSVFGGGAAVNGAPASLTANSFFRMRFDAVFKAWYRVG